MFGFTSVSLYIDKYKSISAFAPIVNPIVGGWGQRALNGYLGDDVNAWKKYDACELVLSGKFHAQPILIEHGLSDEFYPNQLLTNNFVEVCASKNQKLKVNYREAYDHSYYFISTFIDSHKCTLSTFPHTTLSQIHKPALVN